MAYAFEGFPFLEDYLPLLQRLEGGRHLGSNQPGDPRVFAGSRRQESRPERRCRRLAVGKDFRRGRRGARLRRGGKKVRGRKRHLLVDTEGLVLKALRVHSAKVPDQDGIKLLLLKTAREFLPRLSHL